MTRKSTSHAVIDIGRAVCLME